MAEPNTVLVITDNTSNQVNGVQTTFKELGHYGKHNLRFEGKPWYVLSYLDPSSFRNFGMIGYPEVRISIPTKIGELITNLRPYAIHIATEGPVGLMAKIFLDKNNIPYSTSYHTNFPLFCKRLYYIPEFITYRYLKWFHRKSNAILVPSESTKKDLIEHGFDKKQLTVWTRGTKVVAKEYDNHILGWPKYIMYCGRVSKEKNLEDLLVLQDKYNIVIVGDGPMRIKYEKKYTKVKFVGYKHGEDLKKLYRRASVFVFPSKTDTLGLVMLEAMTHGTPVAAYPVPGPIDVVTHGRSGILSDDLDDAIQRCFTVPRAGVFHKAKEWKWSTAWKQFQSTLVECKWDGPSKKN